MNIPNTNFYFWCCIVQSAIIVALAFHVGKLRTEREQLVQEKEMASFALTVREREIKNLKVRIDSCYAEKK